MAAKPCQTYGMELFPQVFTGFRHKLRIVPIESFANMIKN